MPDRTPRRRPRTSWRTAHDMRPTIEPEVLQPLCIATASAERVAVPPNAGNQWRLDFGDPAFGAALARVAAPPPESRKNSIPLTIPLRPCAVGNRTVPQHSVATHSANSTPPLSVSPPIENNLACAQGNLEIDELTSRSTLCSPQASTPERKANQKLAIAQDTREHPVILQEPLHRPPQRDFPSDVSEANKHTIAAQGLSNTSYVNTSYRDAPSPKKGREQPTPLRIRIRPVTDSECQGPHEICEGMSPGNCSPDVRRTDAPKQKAGISQQRYTSLTLLRLRLRPSASISKSLGTPPKTHSASASHEESAPLSQDLFVSPSQSIAIVPKAGGAEVLSTSNDSRKADKLLCNHISDLPPIPNGSSSYEQGSVLNVNSKARRFSKDIPDGHSQPYHSLSPKHLHSHDASRSHIIAPDSCVMLSPSSGSDSDSSLSPIPLAHRHRELFPASAPKDVVVPDSCPFDSSQTQDASTLPPSPEIQLSSESYPASIPETIGPGSPNESVLPARKVIVAETCDFSTPESSKLISPKPQSNMRRIVATSEACPLSTPESNRHETCSEELLLRRGQISNSDGPTNDDVITPVPSRLAAFTRVAGWKPSPRSRVIVPDTPDQSDHEQLCRPISQLASASRQSCEDAPTSQLGAHSESTLYNKSFSSASRSASVFSPTSRGTSNRTGSRFSGTDSDFIGERGRCLVDGEEVNRIRRDLGMSPASSFGPNQSLALDPQAASYALQVLRQSAAIDIPTPSVGDTKPSSISIRTKGSSSSDAQKEDSALGEICPVTPHKAGAVSRIRRNVSPHSSMDESESSSVLRNIDRSCGIAHTGESNDFNLRSFACKSSAGEERLTTPINNCIEVPTGTESDIGTGRSSIDKRTSSRGSKRARQQLRFDVTPMPLRLADENSDEDPVKPREIECESAPNGAARRKKDNGVFESPNIIEQTRNSNKQSMLPSKRKLSMGTNNDPNGSIYCQRNLGAANTMNSMFSTAAGTRISVSKNKLAQVLENNNDQTPNPKRVAFMRHMKKGNIGKETIEVQRDSTHVLNFEKAGSIFNTEKANNVSASVTKPSDRPISTPVFNRISNHGLKPNGTKNSLVSTSIIPLTRDNRNMYEAELTDDFPKFDDGEYDPFCLARKSKKQPRESIESLDVRRLSEHESHLQNNMYGAQRLLVGEQVTPIRADLLSSVSNGKAGTPGSVRVPALSSNDKPIEDSGLVEKSGAHGLLCQPICSTEKYQTGREENLGASHAHFKHERSDMAFPSAGRSRSVRSALNEAPKSVRPNATQELPANPNEKGMVTPAHMPMFTTAKGKSITFSNVNLGQPISHFRQPLFSTGSGRPVAVSKLNEGGANTPAQLPLFSTASGRTVPVPKTPLDQQPFFATARGQRVTLPVSQPLARILPFNTNSSPSRAKGFPIKDLSTGSRKNVSFRALPQNTPKTPGSLLADFSSRRQLFRTPPAKLDCASSGTKSRQKTGGIKNTPFKRPRRVPPVTPIKEMSAEGKVIHETNDLELFFPKGLVPLMTNSGGLVLQDSANTSSISRLSKTESAFFVASPADGVSFCFGPERFGDWSVLPEKLKTFCKLHSSSSFSVEDCISLMCHVFPSAKKRAATRIGSQAWTKMSYGLSIWKLSKLEFNGIGDGHQKANFLTAANLLRDMWRRIDREWHKNQAPHLAQMLRRDASPRSHVVLVLTYFVIEESNVTLEVSDGWYICRMKPCELLTSRIKAGLLTIGDKIHLYDSELVSTPNKHFFFGDGDEMGTSILAPSANCVKKVSVAKTPICRLGIRKSPLFIRLLASLTPKGGKCPGAQVVILRSYPVFFIESLTDHESERRSIFRRREAEETEQAKLHAHRESLWVEGTENKNDEDTVPKVREVRNAIDFSVCGIRDDLSNPKCEKLVRVYKPDEDTLRLLSKEGNVVYLPLMKPAGKNWVVMSASCIRPLAISPSAIIPFKPRLLTTCEDLNGLVSDDTDFDGVFVALHTTALVDKMRHVYMVDNIEDSNVLVLELRGIDAECMPRAFARTNRKHEFPIMALRDVTKEGFNRQLGLIHSFATLRSEVISAATLERRRDTSWGYLQKRLLPIRKLVNQNQHQLQLLREAIISFASGDRSSISAYFSCTQE